MTARTPDYYGWYEMYPADPVYFSNTVRAGDHISASVTFSGTETYTLVLKDTTQGWTQTITKNESGLDRSSAEVITEAPSSETGVLPLADFGTVSYTGADRERHLAGAATARPSIVMVDSGGNARGLHQLDQQLGSLQQHLAQEHLALAAVPGGPTQRPRWPIRRRGLVSAAAGAECVTWAGTRSCDLIPCRRGLPISAYVGTVPAP